MFVRTALAAALVCVVALFLNAPVEVEATHFAYAHLSWAQNTTFVDGTNYKIKVYWEMAWRRSYGWSPSNPSVNDGPIYGYNFCITGAGGYNPGCQNIAQICASVNAAEDWFVGTYSVDVLFPYTANPIRIDHSGGDRLSILEEGNHDNSWRITTVVNVNLGPSGPRSTSVPRLYARAQQQLNFIIPSSAPPGQTNQFTIAPGGASSDSLLTQWRPCGANTCGCRAGCELTSTACRASGVNANYYYYRTPYIGSQPNLPSTNPVYGPFSFCNCPTCFDDALPGSCSVCLTVGKNNGYVSWFPQNAGLYAVQFKIQAVDSNQSPRNSAPLDFIISVLPACSGCPAVTVTGPSAPLLVYVGLETRFDVVATMTNGATGYQLSVSNTPLPTGATISPDCNEANKYPVCTITVRWTPTLGQLGAFVCFQGTAQDFGTGTGRPGPNVNSFGQLCVDMPLGIAALIYLSGIVRDFKPDYPDMARPANENNGVTYVGGQLDALGDPVWGGLVPPAIAAGPPAMTQTSFDRWFHDDPTYNKNQVFSITLTNATQPDPNRYSYLSTGFYPIDCQLWDSTIPNCNPATTHNKYFTYAVHSYTTINANQEFTFRSSDDMWLFINGQLVPGWNLGGVHDDKSFTVYTNNLIKPVAQQGLGLQLGQTYRADLFFAHRGATSTPLVQVQFPQAALCNALSFPQTVITVSDGSFRTGASGNVALTGAARVQNGILQPVQKSLAGPAGGTAWYSVNGVPQLIKLGNGFSTTFKYMGDPATPGGSIPPNSCEGFAFVIQSQSPTAFGGDAGNLNYAPIAKSLAVEFDGFQETYLNDPSFNHISVHSLFDQQNSADENVAQLGINVYDPQLVLSICNATNQTVTIQYLPGQINDGLPPDTPAYGWLRVFMNANLVPTTQAQIDSVKFNAKIGTAAYVGFTSAVSGPPVAVSSTINLYSWSMVVVPTAPGQCSMGQQPGLVTAGSQGSAIIQARDACNNKIRIGGESGQIVVTIAPNFGSGANVANVVTDNSDGTYTVTYTPTVSTQYGMQVTWSGATVQPSGSNPFPFSVQSAATSNTASRLIYSPDVLPVSKLHNAPQTAQNTTQGVQMLVVDKTTAKPKTRRTYDVSVDAEKIAFVADFNAAVTGDIIAISLYNPGSDTSLPSNPINSFRVTGCTTCATAGAWGIADLNTLFSQIGAAAVGTANLFTGGCCVQTRQWAIVGRKAQAGLTQEQYHPRFATAQVCTATTQAPNINYCVKASSGSYQAIGGIQSFVSCELATYSFPASGLTMQNFTVQARDQYGNTVSGSSDQFKVSFSPSISNDSFWGDQTGDVWKATYDNRFTAPGYYNFAFFIRRSGTYQMFVNLLPGDASTPIAGSPFTITVRSGPASGFTTTALGTGLSQAVAGTQQSFQLILNDAGGNPVITLQGDTVTGYVLSPKGRQFPISGALAWSGSGPMTIYYNATEATGVSPQTYYRFFIFVNGEPLVATASQQLTVSPSFVDPAKCGTNLGSTSLVVGSTVSFLIYSRDTYSNDRVTQLDGANVFTVLFNDTDVSNVVVSYLALGTYQCTFSATKAVAHRVTVQYGSGSPVNIRGSINPIDVVFLPGPPSARSIVTAGSLVPNSCPGGVPAGAVLCVTASTTPNNGFDFQSIDANDNTRVALGDTAAFTAVCRDASNLPCTTINALTYVSGSTYRLRWTSTRAGNYTVSMLVASSGATIRGAPISFGVIVNPAASDPTHSLGSGSGLLGGVQGASATFAVQARDVFNNNQLGTVNNPFRYSIDGGGAIGCVKRSQQSLYDCAYTVPNRPDSPFTITVQMQDPAGSGPWFDAFTQPAFASATSSEAFAKPEPLPGPIRTGDAFSFIVRDQRSDGQSIPATIGAAGCACIFVRLEKKNGLPGNGDPAYFFQSAPQVSSTMGVGGDNAKYTVALQLTPSSPGSNDIAGDYWLHVFKNTLESFSTGTTPFSITVRAGEFSVAQSALPATLNAMAGVNFTYTLQMKDAYGQLIVNPEYYAPVIRVATSQGNIAFFGVWSGANNWFAFNMRLTVAETVTGTLFAHGTGQAATTTYTVVTVPNVADAGRSQAVGIYPLALDNNGLTKATAGVAQTFIINAFDAWGNPTSTPASFYVLLTPTNDVLGAPVQDPGTNRYTVSWNANFATASGTIDVKIGGSGGSPVGVTYGSIGTTASPYSIVVVPGSVSAPLSSVSVGSTPIAAGTAYSALLSVKDGSNNAWQSNNIAAISALFRAPDSQTVVAIISAGPGAGQYYLTVGPQNIDPLSAKGYPFTAQVGGFVLTQVRVSVGASQTDITNGLGASGFSVIPAAPAAINSVFVSAPFTEIPAETTTTVRLQLYDAFGNIITSPPATAVAFSIYGGSSPTCAFSQSGELSGSPQRNGPRISAAGFQVAAATDAGAGVYQAIVGSSVQGLYYVNATVNGAPINCITTTQQTIKVSSGVANGNYTYAYGAPLQAGAINQAGTVLRFEVSVRDRLGNLRVADGRDNVTVGVVCPGSTTSPNCLAAAVDVTQYGLSADQTKWVSRTSLAGANITVTYDNPATYNAGGAPAGWGETYHVTVSTTRADTYSLVMAVNGQVIRGLAPAPWATFYRTLKVVAGPAASWTQIFAITATAAYPASFPLTTIDVYNNVIDGPGLTGFSYEVKFKSLDSIDYLFYGTPVPDTNTGITNVNFMAAWPGTYEVNVALLSSAPGFQAPSDRPSFSLNVSSATCAAVDPTKPLRCPINRVCVASYDDCTDIPAPAKNNCQVRCTYDGSCRNPPATAADCPCAPGMTKCAAGQCANVTANSNACLLPADCPTSAPYKCLNAAGQPTGQCRVSAADCPSIRVCPPGLFMCGDSVTCVASNSTCPPPPICPAGYGPCPDNSCARAIEDCPTPKTCPAERPALCPDGSCQTTYKSCPDMYQCFAPNAYRCADGSCRPDYTSCPSSVVCPSGSLLCENGQCAATLAACSPALQCPRTEVRCPDGSCAQNLLFCPSRTTCPATTPVLCSDGSCSTSSFLCPPLASCPTGTFTCPGGACVANLNNCPTPVTCPSTYPVLCSDGSCQQNAASCQPTQACPSDNPLRCPDGSCRSALLDCPTASSCPDTRPVRCFDGACAVAIGLCADPSVYQCTNGTVRCPGGECAVAASLCPSHVSCLTGFLRCLDGSCRADCTEVNAGAAKPCPNGQVLCPQSNTGNLCASSLANCPQGLVCPALSPVKCVDASCADSVGNCPPPPSQYADSTTFQLCPDGTWASNGASTDSCARPPTCPANAPYKCYDLTCRIAPSDCPTPPRCPLTTPYLCPNGNCVDRLWSCKPYGQCDTSSFNGQAYVQCADPGHTCKLDISQCPPLLQPTATSTDTCPYLWTYCKDGSCKEQSGQCKDLTCPDYLPFTCPTGLCVLNTTQCPLPNGCPFDNPVRCWTGKCRKSQSECLNIDQEPPAARCVSEGVACPDGSCALNFDQCPNANGCNIGEIKCLDGRCASYAPGSPYNPCLAGSDATNACPGNRPFRCTDGFCALSSTTCPPPALPPTSVCGPSAPMLCADGSCVKAAVQCPLVYDCPTGQVRCLDGSCRNDGTCPCNDEADGGLATCGDATNTCPTDPSTGLQLRRCGNGLCSESLLTCPTVATGCPSAQFKCGNGACIDDPSYCSNYTQPATGCPAGTPFKCSNGACAASNSLCPLANGCLPSAPYLCFADGSCHATPSCAGIQTCEAQGKVRCAGGQCAANAAACNAANGCPIATPIRCANGQCGSFPAGSGMANACPLVTACENKLDTLCYNGACVASPAFCPPRQSCNPFQIVCADFTCANSAAECPSGNTCPAASPIACADGFCKKTVAACTATISSTVAGGKCASPNVVCFDGSCRANSLACMQWASDARVTGDTQNVALTIANVCPGSTALCSDGSCMPSKYDCPIVAACPRFERPLRCWDGSCVNATSACPAAPATDCGVGAAKQRCEDGSCRDEGTCLPFDGCSLALPWQCLDRRCVASMDQCAILFTDYQNFKNGGGSGSAATQSLVFHAKDMAVYQGLVLAEGMVNLNQSTWDAVPTDPSIVDPAFIRYGEDFDGNLYWPCNTSCRGEVKAARTLSSVAVSAATTIPVAYQDGNVIAQVLVPSGSLLRPTSNSSYDALANILIRPVSESRMRRFTNYNVAGRGLDFVYTVISPAFECVVDAYVTQPFVVNLTYTANIDSAPQLWGQQIGTLPDGRTDALTEFLENVCLATPQYQYLIDTYVWKCLVFPTAARAATPVRAAGSNSAPSVVSQTFGSCGQNGTVYAFIFSPPYIPVQLDSVSSWVDANIQWILLVLVGTIVFVVSVGYFGSRLYRYRSKLHKERKEVKNLQAEVDDMEQFGGRVRKDSDVQMVDNPMSVQLKEMQARYDANELKLRQAETEQRAALSAERQEAIKKMEEDRNMMSLELENLKKQLDDQEALALQSKQKAMEAAAASESAQASLEVQAQAKAGAEVQRSEFAVAKPKRRQLSRNID